jgi:hypothetical protein
MPKPIVFIAALLLALPAFAQTRMPAHQVEADTNMVNIAVSLPFTAQVALDWIDANWPAFSSESWSNLDPAEDTVQSVFDWVDDNWQAKLNAEGWGYLSPEAPATAQGTFDWIDAYMGINTNNWNYLAPTASTVQATFTWLDDRFFGFDPEAVIMPGSNIVGAALVSNQWTGLMQGTNIANAAYDPATLTWGGLMQGTNIFFSRYSETNKTWTPVQYHPDSYFFWAGNNGGKTGSPVKTITNGAAASFNFMHDYITATNIFSDAGGWMDLSTGVLTLPVTGLYDIRYSCVAVGASVMLGYILNGGPGAHPRGGGWGSSPGQSATTLWAGYDAFHEGDEIEFVYYPSVNLSSDAYVTQFFIYVRLVGPFPTGDFMSFREFNEQ